MHCTALHCTAQHRTHSALLMRHYAPQSLQASNLGPATRERSTSTEGRRSAPSVSTLYNTLVVALCDATPAIKRYTVFIIK